MWSNTLGVRAGYRWIELAKSTTSIIDGKSLFPRIAQIFRSYMLIIKRNRFHNFSPLVLCILIRIVGSDSKISILTNRFFKIMKVKFIFLLTSLDISDVNTVWTWGDKCPPPISKYFKAIFSPSHIKLTNDNQNKDFKSVERQ